MIMKHIPRPLTALLVAMLSLAITGTDLMAAKKDKDGDKEDEDKKDEDKKEDEKKDEEKKDEEPMIDGMRHLLTSMAVPAVFSVLRKMSLHACETIIGAIRSCSRAA